MKLFHRIFDGCDSRREHTLQPSLGGWKTTIGNQYLRTSCTKCECFMIAPKKKLKCLILGQRLAPSQMMAY